MWALFCKTLALSSNALLGTDHLLQLLQRFGTVCRTILRKRMILISLRDSLERTILKSPIAPCLELSQVYIFYRYLLFLLLTCYELC